MADEIAVWNAVIIMCPSIFLIRRTASNTPGYSYLDAAIIAGRQ